VSRNEPRGTLTEAVRVQVRLGAGLATAAGSRRLTVALPDGASVDTLLDELRELEPQLAAGLDSALPVVRGTHADRDQALNDGDDVALLIPVAGGAPGPAKPERRSQWQ
jgi:molybdopterin converting factor small subunit